VGGDERGWRGVLRALRFRAGPRGEEFLHG